MHSFYAICAKTHIVRVEEFTEVTVMITVFWNVMPCSLVYKYTDVSEECSASIFRVKEL
jgi:hypothetical protein